MTTTPDPTDLDELRDLNEAATPAPWQIDFAIGDGTHEISAAPDVLLCYCVGTDHDVTLIVKMRNTLPRLLAELDRSRSQITAMGQTIAAFPDANNAANIAHARAQRDGYREELAKTRAELDLALPLVREGALAEHHSKCGESSQWDIRRCEDADCLERAHLLEAHGLIPQEWDTYPIPEANPATTAEPADEPKATCHLPVQNGEPCGLLTCRKHGCRVAPHTEPAAG